MTVEKKPRNKLLPGDWARPIRETTLWDRPGLDASVNDLGQFDQDDLLFVVCFVYTGIGGGEALIISSRLCRVGWVLARLLVGIQER